MRMTNLLKTTVLGILGITVACTMSPQMDEDIAQTTKQALTLKQQAAVPDTPVPDDVVRVKNDIWLGDSSKVEFEGEPVPTYLEAKDGITLISNRPITLFEIGNMISKITSLSVRYAPELEDDDEIKDVADENEPSLEDIGAQWTDSTKMLVNYKGPLSGLLDEVANRFGVWWKYEKNEIYFYRYITKTFVIYSLPTNPNLNVNIGIDGGGSGGDDGSSGQSAINQTSDVSKLNLWDQIREALDAMITEKGSVSYSEANGTVTVTDTPANIRRIAKYINEQNDRLSKQVAISVKVFQISLSDTDSYGFSLEKLGFSGGSIKSLVATTGSAIPDVNNNLSMAISSGKWDVNAAIQALSAQENTKLVTSGTVTTMNNKPAPIQVTRSHKYAEKVEVSSTSTGSENNDTSIEPGDFTTGFMMSILPRILDHGRLMVFFNLTLAELIRMPTFTSGNATVQQPEIETRGFTQEVAMKSGQTLVLAGYERVEDKVSKEGVGNPDNMLLGGKNIADKGRSLLVIMLTPVVLETPLSPESRMSD